jgi:hypothetical protein
VRYGAFAERGKGISAFQCGYDPTPAMPLSKSYQLAGQPSVILCLKPQLRQGIGNVGVETGGHQQQVGRKGIDRGEKVARPSVAEFS